MKGQNYNYNYNVHSIGRQGGHNKLPLFADVCAYSVVFAGDLFESVSDIENPSCWTAVSQWPRLQAASRYEVVTQFTVRFIIPGHGAMFQLTENHLKLLASQKNSICDVS